MVGGVLSTQARGIKLVLGADEASRLPVLWWSRLWARWEEMVFMCEGGTGARCIPLVGVRDVREVGIEVDAMGTTMTALCRA